jgi:hypothetical protein
LVGAAVLLIQIAPALATDNGHNNRPVDVTFTKWVVPTPPPQPPPAPQPAGATLAGVTGGDIAGTFVGEVLWGQTSQNGHVRGLEAMYEVYATDEDKSFSALIRGGQDQVGGLGQLDGVILAGWRTGARVHVVFQRYPITDAACVDAAGAPASATVCFVGTIHVGRAPRD